MSELDKKLLQQELAFYTTLLKKHESASNSSTSKQLQILPSKMPHVCNNNVFKSTSIPTHLMKPSQPMSSKPLCQNKRTILLNKTKYVADRSRKSEQNFRELKLPPDRFINEKSSVKNAGFSHIRNCVAKTETSSLTKKSSESEELLKEIAILTNLIRKSNDKSADKSNAESVANKAPVNSAFKSSASGCEKNIRATDVQDAVTALHPNCKFTASAKRRTVVNPRISQSLASTSHLTSTAKDNAFPETKYPFKVENNVKRNVYSKFSTTSVSSAASNFQNIESQGDNGYQIIDSKHVVKNSKVETFSKRPELNPFSLEHKKIKQQSFPPKYSFVSKKVKTPVAIKQGVFSKIHEKNSRQTVKHRSKNKLIYNKLSPVSPKFKNLNSKYKIVNKASAQNSSKIWRKNSFESSMLNKSDPLFDFLNSSEIDKLEKEILAVSTSIIATPGPSTSQSLVAGSKSCLKKLPKYKLLASKYKIVNKNINHKNSRLMLSRTPVKKLKMLSSKYKIVNKNLKTPKSLSYKSKEKTPLKNPVRKISKKVILTKFAIVNKHSSVISPSPKLNSVLVKRLYKSKSTLINKNDSPTSYSAKLIKSKYFGVRRKSSVQKQYLHPKIVAKMQKYGGSYNNSGLVSNKCGAYSGTKRLFYKKKNYISARQYCKSNVNIYKRKGNKVLNIRGSRYSMSLSGKKIRRLPTKGHLWINKAKRFVVKPYLKQPESVLKTTNLPVSLHVANRVLHRSINRALNASTKKSLSKVNTYCMFYNRFGRCNRGVKCTYIHDPSKIAVCTRFLRGTCKTEGCPFSHEVAPGKMAICSFFLVGACDKDDCPYRHEPLAPNAILCKAFVQGYCPKGKECNKAHVLICPKFILGECDKGRSCAYPHPPQKAKKVVPKDTVVNKVVPPCDNTKDDDGLLEKVARYFQSEGNPIPYASEKNSFRMFVPRPRKLEEQPAFIPLSHSSIPSQTTDVVDKL